jgi:hypothetical protein
MPVANPLNPVLASYRSSFLQAAVLVFGLLLLLFVLEAIRRGRLKERYALLWLGTTGALILLAAWRRLLDHIALFLGVYYPPSLFFLVGLLSLLAIILHFSLVLSEYSDKTRRLTQHMALLAQKVEQLQQHIDRGASAPP